MYIQKKNSSNNEIGGNYKFTKKAYLRNLRQPNKVFLRFPVVASKSVLFFFLQEENVDAVSSILLSYGMKKNGSVPKGLFFEHCSAINFFCCIIDEKSSNFFFQNFLLVQETSLWIQYFGSWYHHSIQYTGRYCN